MFDIPDAKRVRREDLLTTSRASSPVSASTSLPADPDLERAFREQLAALYGPISTTIPSESESRENERIEGADPELKEQEFEFRLFSTPYIPHTNSKQATKNSGATSQESHIQIQKIILEDEQSEDGEWARNREGRFLRPRPRTYYFSAPLSETRKKEFEFAALSGDQIFELAGKRAWGLEVPWRVRVIKSSPSVTKISIPSSKTNRRDGEEVMEREGNKSKPGKKRRIILRERKRKREVNEEARKRKEEEKERAEREKRTRRNREKRTRRNREKKVKRKMKEKEKKVGAGVGTGDVLEGAKVDGAGNNGD